MINKNTQLLMDSTTTTNNTNMIAGIIYGLIIFLGFFIYSRTVIKIKERRNKIKYNQYTYRIHNRFMQHTEYNKQLFREFVKRKALIETTMNEYNNTFLQHIEEMRCIQKQIEDSQYTNDESVDVVRKLSDTNYDSICDIDNELDELRNKIEYLQDCIIDCCIPSDSELYLYNAFMTMQTKELEDVYDVNDYTECSFPENCTRKDKYIYTFVRTLYKNFKQTKGTSFTRYLLTQSTIPEHTKKYINKHKDFIDCEYQEYEGIILV